MTNLGVSLRFIQHYDPTADKSFGIFDRVLLSCLSLGHTFVINQGEAFCNVCGVPNPDPFPHVCAGDGCRICWWVRTRGEPR